MSAFEVGKKLVELCKKGEHEAAVKSLYSPDIVSVEAAEMPGLSREARGAQALAAKSKWWAENHIIHSQEVEGPWPHGNRFVVRFKYDVTNKPSNQRFQMDEVGLYTVENGKVVREEFFYPTQG
jgi:hypothetical protein